MSRSVLLAAVVTLIGCSSAPPLEALRGEAAVHVDHIFVDPDFEAGLTIDGVEVEGRCPPASDTLRATYDGVAMTRDPSDAPGCGYARFTLRPTPPGSGNPRIVIEDDTDHWEIEVVDPLTQRTCTVTPDPILAGSPFTVTWDNTADTLNADSPEADVCSASTCYPLANITRTGPRTYEVASFTDALGAMTLHLNPDPQLAHPVCDGPSECFTPGAFIGCGTAVTVVQP